MMRVSEAVQFMTKAYLHRIIDSFTKDLTKPDEERSREIIVRNEEELTDAGRIATVLSRNSVFSHGILTTYILDALINRPEHSATEEELVGEVQALEEAVLDEAGDPDAFRYADQRALEILEAVLAVAIEDDRISEAELGLIEKLRQKLGIHGKNQQILLARLNHFPRAGNRLHSPSDLRDLLIELQRKGVVFYCNRLDGGKFVIPEEVVPGIKAALGIEMTRLGWTKLLEALTNTQLSTILEGAGLPKSGTKDALQARIVEARLQPVESLEQLSSDDLYSILSSLPGAKVSGSKERRLHRLIEYFDKMVFREVPDEASPAEIYYQYLPELAARDREILLANKVIRKDREMESAFEMGTCHLFSEKLGLELLGSDGSDHCDGWFEIGKRGDVFMWDNKSKETTYTFPPSHLRQFKRYIRDCSQRVACFLVIAPEIADEAAQMAARLKIESGTDTDVALIAAEDLKWVADEWTSLSDGKKFDPEVFNLTGILDRTTLESRLRLFL